MLAAFREVKQPSLLMKRRSENLKICGLAVRVSLSTQRDSNVYCPRSTRVDFPEDRHGA